MTAPEILPCPWCGGKAKLSPGLRWSVHSWVRCPSVKCLAIGPHSNDATEAIAAWNRVAQLAIDNPNPKD